jgi:hypothetical protein
MKLSDIYFSSFLLNMWSDCNQIDNEMSRIFSGYFEAASRHRWMLHRPLSWRGTNVAPTRKPYGIVEGHFRAFQTGKRPSTNEFKYAATALQERLPAVTGTDNRTFRGRMPLLQKYTTGANACVIAMLGTKAAV